MKNKILKLKKKAKLTLAVLQLTVCSMMFPITAEAAGEKKNPLKETTLFKGTMALLTDLFLIILAATAGVVLVMCAYNGVKYLLAAEDEKNKYPKRVKEILVAGLLIMVAEGTITAVFAYFSV